MDICMLTPSERAAIQKAVEEYEQAKTNVLVMLEQIEREWEQEIEDKPDTWFEEDKMIFRMERYGVLAGWIDNERMGF
jgi:hypothetical protein